MRSLTTGLSGQLILAKAANASPNCSSHVSGTKAETEASFQYVKKWNGPYKDLINYRQTHGVEIFMIFKFGAEPQILCT